MLSAIFSEAGDSLIVFISRLKRWPESRGLIGNPLSFNNSLGESDCYIIISGVILGLKKLSANETLLLLQKKSQELTK